MRLSILLISGEVLSIPHAYDRVMSWESEVDKYTKALRVNGKTEGYIQNAKTYLSALGRALKPKSFMDLSRDQMFDWLIEIRDHGISGRGPLADASMNSIKGTIKACFRFLNDGETPKSLKGITVGKNRSRVRAKDDLPTDEEVSHLAKALSTQKRAICLAIRYSGARPSEVLGLKRGDVSPEFDLTFQDTKTGDHRTVPLVNREAVTALRDWMGLAPDNGYLFPSPLKKGEPLGYQSFWIAMKRAAEKLGVKPILPYYLRHARATELFDSPSGLRNRLMGWKSDNMARNYEALDTQDARTFLEEREGKEETTPYADLFEAFRETYPILGDPELEKEWKLILGVVGHALLIKPDGEGGAVPYSDSEVQEYIRATAEKIKGTFEATKEKSE